MESTARQSRDERSAFVTSKDLENRIAAAEALILKQTIHVVDSRNKELERRWDELEDRVEERTASRAAEDEEKLSHVAKVSPSECLIDQATRSSSGYPPSGRSSHA